MTSSWYCLGSCSRVNVCYSTSAGMFDNIAEKKMTVSSRQRNYLSWCIETRESLWYELCRHGTAGCYNDNPWHHQWRHTWHNLWWRHHMETFSALLDLCEENPPITNGFPTQRPVTGILEQTIEQTIETPVIWGAMALIMPSAVMSKHSPELSIHSVSHTSIPREHKTMSYIFYSLV